MNRCTRHAGIVIASLALGFASSIHAQRWPDKPVRIIVATPPGGGDDYIARLLAPKLAETLGQPFLAENRPGAGGVVAQHYVMKAVPDGYTWLVAGASMAGARFVNASAKYDVLRDFTPVSLIETSPFVMLIHPTVPARSAKEYIALARKQPGKMTFATLGPGQIPYWGAHLFNSMAGIQALEVPYKAFGEVISDLIGGRVDYFFAPAPTAIGLKEKLRPLAVTTGRRSAVLPDIPTFAESGLPGYDMPAWRSIMGPAGIHDEVVRSLNATLTRLLATQEVREKLRAAGSEAQSSTPQELSARYATWIERFGTLAQHAGIRPQ